MIILTTDFLVKKDDIQQVKFVKSELDPAVLKLDQMLLEVDKFAFTTNNITYALLGDRLQYWQFFPTNEAEWGKIPVWGFGDVIHTNHDNIVAGERIYGYFPLATHLIVEPAKITDSAFYDKTIHRRELNSVYNQYIRVANDPAYGQEYEGLQALLRPLFTTSFLIDDFLADNDFFGGQTVVLSSASSKTAYGTAFSLHKNRPERRTYEIIGLTSTGNIDFVEQLGFYDKVLSYEQIEEFVGIETAVFVDFTGNAELLAQIHHHYQDKLVYSCLVGFSHGGEIASGYTLPGAKPKMFFAPAQVQKRLRDWGGQEFQLQLAQAWEPFLKTVQTLLTVQENRGAAAVTEVYHAFVMGKARPEQGYILSW